MNRLDINEVAMRNPKVAIVQTTKGWNVGRILARRADAKPGRARPVSIGRILITDGEIHVAPLDAPSRDLTAVQFDGGLSYKDSRLTLNSTHFSAVDPDTNVELREVALRRSGGENQDQNRREHRAAEAGEFHDGAGSPQTGQRSRKLTAFSRRTVCPPNT